MLDECSIQLLRPVWREADLPGIGAIRVRRPTLGEATRSSTDRNWWACCVQARDGSPLFPSSFQVDDLDADVAMALLSEINKPRPTQPASAESGASLARGSD
jgi:hypothetical protein